jgi:hypothetical protein
MPHCDRWPTLLAPFEALRRSPAQRSREVLFRRRQTPLERSRVERFGPIGHGGDTPRQRRCGHHHGHPDSDCQRQHGAPRRQPLRRPLAPHQEARSQQQRRRRQRQPRR